MGHESAVEAVADDLQDRGYEVVARDEYLTDVTEHPTPDRRVGKVDLVASSPGQLVAAKAAELTTVKPDEVERIHEDKTRQVRTAAEFLESTDYAGRNEVIGYLEIVPEGELQALKEIYEEFGTGGFTLSDAAEALSNDGFLGSLNQEGVIEEGESGYRIADEYRRLTPFFEFAVI